MNRQPIDRFQLENELQPQKGRPAKVQVIGQTKKNKQLPEVT